MQSIGPVLVQSILYTICALCVAYTGIKSYNYYKQKIKVHKTMWHFALTTFICVTLSFITAVFFIPLITFNHHINLCPAFLIIQVILSSMFKISLYLFFLQRIHTTFQFSMHAIQPCFINILRTITITYWTTVTILQCVLIYPSSEISHIGSIYFCDLFNKSQRMQMDVLFISDCISESILCPLMLLLFIRGLYSVVSTRKNLSVRESVTLSNSMSDNINSNLSITNLKHNKLSSPSNGSNSASHKISKSLNNLQTLSPISHMSNHTRSRSETMSEDGYDYNNKKDRNFVYAMTKFTTLATLSFLTSMFVYLILLICKYTSKHTGFTGLDSGLLIFIRLVFDQMINCICVYFVFRFTDQKYHKYCFIPHQIQIKCMVSLCPKTKPMFQVAKLEYQKIKIGMKRYASHSQLNRKKENTIKAKAKAKKKSQNHSNINNNNLKINNSNNDLETVPEVNINKKINNNTNLTIKNVNTKNVKGMVDLLDYNNDNNDMENTRITETTETETVEIYCDENDENYNQTHMNHIDTMANGLTVTNYHE